MRMVNCLNLIWMNCIQLANRLLIMIVIDVNFVSSNK